MAIAEMLSLNQQQIYDYFIDYELMPDAGFSFEELLGS